MYIASQKKLYNLAVLNKLKLKYEKIHFTLSCIISIF